MQTSLPELPTTLSAQIRNILARRLAQRGGRALRFFVARQNMDAAEIEFADLLAEDHNNAALAYADCACAPPFLFVPPPRLPASLSYVTGIAAFAWARTLPIALRLKLRSAIRSPPALVQTSHRSNSAPFQVRSLPSPLGFFRTPAFALSCARVCRK
jgi:hypothetical protein